MTDSDREDQGEDDSENIIKQISAEVNGTDNIEINISGGYRHILVEWKYREGIDT